METPLPSLVTRTLLLSVLLPATIVMAHPDDPKARELANPDLPAPGGVAGFPATNVELRAHISPQAFGTGAQVASDCWGYTAPSGREYAIIGLRNATAFVEITDPSNPVIVDTFQWTTCIWYDMKVFEDHAYVVNDCAAEMQIFNLSLIDSGVIELVNTDLFPSDSHNVVIDTTSGFLYRTGGGNAGLVIYDLNQNKATPPVVASWQDRYVHDAWAHTYTSGPWAGREIVFCNGGFNGGGVETGIDVLDVTDKKNIILLDRYEIPAGSYSHQGCLSADGTLFYMGDETDGQCESRIIDVSDLENIFQVDTFENGLSCTDHNQYVRGDLVFQANYKTGLRIFSLNDPLAPTEVGFFDTIASENGPGFSGLWSNFPYFPSGRVIGSGTGGLWVWDVTLPCDADLDGSGAVDAGDLASLLAVWGECLGCPEDLDQDGAVGPADLSILLAAWGDC